MLAQVVLTPTESKKLISKAIANMAEAICAYRAGSRRMTVLNC
jgi:hypothetical protein